MWRWGVAVVAVVVGIALVGGAPLTADDADSTATLPRGLLPPSASSSPNGNEDPCRGPGSGGRAVAHLAGAREVRSAAARRDAPEGCLYRTGFNAAEPTLGVTKKGTLYYQTLDANTWPAFPVQVIRSTDEGRTWKDVSPKLGPENRHPYTEDPYLYVDEDTGRVFTVDFLLPCSELSFTDDGGKSWTTVVTGCDVVDHQSIFSGPAPEGGLEPRGYPNVVYYCAADVGLATATVQSSCLRSLDGGLTFARTGQPAFTADPDAGTPLVECDGLHGHGVVGRDGTVYLPKGLCGQPWLAISRDQGFTWERVQVAENGTPTHEAGVAVDARGNIFYTWIGRDRLPYLAVSQDGGKSWTKPLMVGAPGVKEANLPGIAVGDAGKIALIYMGSTNSPGEHFQGSYADVTWNGYITISTNALADDPMFFSGVVNSPDEPLIEGQCGPGRCQAAFDFLDVVIGPDGTPWASFVDGCFKGRCDHSGRFLRLGEAVVGRLVGGPKLR